MTFSDSDSMLSLPLRQREFFVSGCELWDWWQQARQQAIAHRIPLKEVNWLFLELSNLKPLDLRLGSFREREQVELEIPLERLITLWQQRVKYQIPVQYLIGRTPWREFSLQVSPAVLIPRPETELLIDLAIGLRQEGEEWETGRRGDTRTGKHGDGKTSTPYTPHPTPSPNWADLGTGSGAIALALATAFPDATIHAVDYSAEALAIAQANAATYNLSDRIQFYQGSWLEPLPDLKGKLSGIVANPPYIPKSQIPSLQPEVTRHEPHLALDGGADGLDCIRHLVVAAPEYLRSGGWWLVEMMAGQAEVVANLLDQNGNYDQIQTHLDLGGIERFAVARRR